MNMDRVSTLYFVAIVFVMSLHKTRSHETNRSQPLTSQAIQATPTPTASIPHVEYDVITSSAARGEKCRPKSPTKVTWSKESYPNPDVDIDSCGMKCVRSRLCDPGGWLIPERVHQLKSLLDRPFGRECPCARCDTDPYSVYLAIVTRLPFHPWAKPRSHTKQTEAKEFADYLNWKWGQGSKCKDRSVVVVSVEDHVMGVSFGKDVTDENTRICLEKSRDRVLSQFNDIPSLDDHVLDEFFNDYRSAFSGESCADPVPSRWYVTFIIVLVLIAIFASLGFLWYNGRCSMAEGEDTSEMWKRRRPSYRPYTGSRSTWKDEDDEDDEDDDVGIVADTKGEDDVFES